METYSRQVSSLRYWMMACQVVQIWSVRLQDQSKLTRPGYCTSASYCVNKLQLALSRQFVYKLYSFVRRQ
jgi:hypothetical protein